MTERRAKRRVAALLALPMAAALALALAGCAGGKGGPGVATAAEGAAASASAAANGEGSGNGDVTDQMRAFAACMREQGIDLPDPQTAGGGEGGPALSVPDGEGGTASGGPEGEPPDRDKLEAAHKKCQHLLPNGGDLPKPDAAAMEKVRAFAACMREHGITAFPDPDADGKTMITPEDGFDPRDPAFQEAQKACEHLMPKGPGGESVGTTGGGGTVGNGTGGGK